MLILSVSLSQNVKFPMNVKYFSGFPPPPPLGFTKVCPEIGEQWIPSSSLFFDAVLAPRSDYNWKAYLYMQNSRLTHEFHAALCMKPHLDNVLYLWSDLRLVVVNVIQELCAGQPQVISIVLFKHWETNCITSYFHRQPEKPFYQTKVVFFLLCI